MSSIAATDGPYRTTAPRLRPAGAGRVGTAQLVAVEAAALVMGGAVTVLPPAPAAVAVVLSVSMALALLGRRRGRWWYEVVGAWLRLRRWRRDGLLAAARAGADHGWAQVCRLGMALNIQNTHYKDGDVGVGLDERGWFAAVELTGSDETGDAAARLSLRWLTPLAGPLTTLQVLVRDAASAGADLRSPCGRSYQELRQSLAVPARRQVWVAVRLAPRDAADVVAVPERSGRDAGDADEGEVAGVHATLGAAVARIGEALGSRGIGHRILGGPGLRHALVTGYGPDPAGGNPGRARTSVRESWWRWRAGRAVHLCFAAAAWPDRAGPELLPALAAVPGALAVNVAVVIGAARGPAHHGPPAVRVLVRVVTTAELAGHCQRRLRESARRVGARLVRLDGEHAPAVYATMPTASPDGWDELW